MIFGRPHASRTGVHLSASTLDLSAAPSGLPVSKGITPAASSTPPFADAMASGEQQGAASGRPPRVMTPATAPKEQKSAQTAQSKPASSTPALPAGSLILTPAAQFPATPLALAPAALSSDTAGLPGLGPASQPLEVLASGASSSAAGAAVQGLDPAPAAPLPAALRDSPHHEAESPSATGAADGGEKRIAGSEVQTPASGKETKQPEALVLAMTPASSSQHDAASGASVEDTATTAAMLPLAGAQDIVHGAGGGCRSSGRPALG